MDFFERAKCTTTELKCVNSQSNVNNTLKDFPNNADLNVQNPVMCFVIKQSKQKFLCCFLFSLSKHINPTEVNLFFSHFRTPGTDLSIGSFGLLSNTVKLCNPRHTHDVLCSECHSAQHCWYNPIRAPGSWDSH